MKNLINQHFPLIPKEIIYFEGKKKKTSYILEKYLVSDRKLPCFLCYNKDINSSNKYTTSLIELGIPEKVPIPNHVLYMLYKLRYGQFVIEYFSFHKPEKLEKARNKVFNYLISSMENSLPFN